MIACIFVAFFLDRFDVNARDPLVSGVHSSLEAPLRFVLILGNFGVLFLSLGWVFTLMVSDIFGIRFLNVFVNQQDLFDDPDKIVDIASNTELITAAPLVVGFALLMTKSIALGLM